MTSSPNSTLSRPTSPLTIFLAYAEGGVGKTSLGGTLVKWIKRKYGLKSRLVYADTSIKPLQPLIDGGLLEAMQLDLWANPFLAMNLVTKGYWPENVGNPNSRLLPGVKQWKACPKCGKDIGATDMVEVLKCRACKADVSSIGLPTIQELMGGMDKIGAYLFEGITSWGDILMTTQSRRLAAGEIIGNIEKDKTTNFQDGVDPESGKPFMIGGNTFSHYDVSQDYLRQYVANTKKLPVEVVYWTGLESKTTEWGVKGSKSVYAPSIPGQKASAKSISWFTDVGHLDLVDRGKDKDGMQQFDRVLYLAPHFAADDPVTPYKAKTSPPPEGGMPKMIKPDFATFFEEFEKANLKAKELDKELFD